MASTVEIESTSTQILYSFVPDLAGSRVARGPPQSGGHRQAQLTGLEQVLKHSSRNHIVDRAAWDAVASNGAK